MTTQRPSIAVPTTPRTPSRRLIGVAVGAVLAVVAGAAIWQTERHSNSSTTDSTSQSATVVEQPAAARTANTTVTTVDARGGMGELYAQQQADRFADEAARMRALGGADTPYRTSVHSTCGTVEGGWAC